MRRLLEKVSREIVIKRKLPKKFGALPLYVSPDSTLSYWKNLERTDPFLLDICADQVRTDDIVWDIGANVGLFTFSAAFLAGPKGRVLAIEPDIFLGHLLQKSTQLIRNNFSDKTSIVDILPVAVSDHVGLVKFNIAERGRATNFLAEASLPQQRAIRETREVMSVTLDWLLEFLPAPTLVKIDVECAEDKVLQGASKLLSEIRPRIICEVSPTLVDKVGHLFSSNDYAIYNAELSCHERQELSIPAWNTLALPRNRN